MTARTALLIAIVVGFILLLAALSQWARDARWEKERRLLVAQRTQTLPTGSFATPLPSRIPEGPLAPPPLPTPLPVSLRYVTEKLPQPVASYLNQLIVVEGERRQLWSVWNESLAPDSKLPPIDFIDEAEKWDKALRVDEIDSTCLPFHVAYEHFLAQEKDYLKRLVVLQEKGDSAALALLQEEEEAQRPLRLARLQGRLREIQLAYPHLPEKLAKFRMD